MIGLCIDDDMMTIMQMTVYNDLKLMYILSAQLSNLNVKLINSIQFICKRDT